MAGIVGIDVGGTFTDLFFSGDATRPHLILKVPSTPRDPSIGLLDSLQAAGLAHPSGLTAHHIVRRNSEHAVKLLANLLPFVQPGELLRGEMNLQVFRVYWPMAQAASFSVAAPLP